MAKADAGVVVVIQTCDGASGYNALMDVTEPVNRAYCDRHGYEYRPFRGIKRGTHPWQATMNRLYMLLELREEALARAATAGASPRWVLYLDADAMVVDHSVAVETVTREPESVGKALLVCRGCGDDPAHLADINAGVLLFDVAHPDAGRLLEVWRGLLELAAPAEALSRAVRPWSLATDRGFAIEDQSTLSLTISALQTLGAAPRLVRRFCGPGQNNRFNYGGGWIRQEIRGSSPELQLDRRAAALREAAAGLPGGGEGRKRTPPL